MKCLIAGTLAAFVSVVRLEGQPQISQDRELKEFDLTNWDCLQRPEGSARTPDGIERNRLKNRSAPPVLPTAAEPLDTAAFLRRMADFAIKTKAKRRSELGTAERQQLDTLEKEIVHFTGYLIAAYCGPPRDKQLQEHGLTQYSCELDGFRESVAHRPVLTVDPERY